MANGDFFDISLLGNDKIKNRKGFATSSMQCLFGETEDMYHQPIDRSGITPASRLQRSVGQRREKKKRRNVMTRSEAKNREISLGFPGFVKPVFTVFTVNPFGEGKDHWSTSGA
ncbi:hypothetical protein TNCV_1495311 [Trichonephila clavipes]|nr:hypothetical protein TNCV_1495311 [Trichonephila clavipes]